MKFKNIILSIALLVFAANYLQAQEYDSYINNKKTKLNFNSSDKSKKSTDSFSILNSPKYFGMTFKKTKSAKRFELNNQTHNNIDIYSATIKVNFDDNGTPILYSDNTINYSVVGKGEFPDVELIESFSNINTSDILESEKIYFPISESEIIPAIKIYYEKENRPYLSIFNSEYDIIYNKSLSFEKDINTKTANASVFLPDPITSAHATYGDDGFVNNSGASNPILEAEQIDVAIECRFDGTNYFLEND
ncbi:MAG: hypothetical protein KAG37_04680, partial [Flavobacteriales bacterium]|nr:hypothetical protein [Flavobacteriales bacterium]